MKAQKIQALVEAQTEGTVLIMNPKNRYTGVNVVIVRNGDFWVSIGPKREEFQHMQVIQGLCLGNHTWAFS